MTTTARRRTSSVLRILAWMCLVCSSLPLNADDAPPHSAKRIGSDPKTGIAQAVVVDSAALLHTRQFLPVDPFGEVVGQTLPVQADAVWKQMSSALRAQGLAPNHLVKLNVCVANETVAGEFQQFLAARLQGQPAVAVSVVQSRLPKSAALLSIDAVAVADPPAGTRRIGRTNHSPRSLSAILPAGSKLYVSGQAEKGADLAEATHKTLVSLQSTLRHLGSDLADVVQVKGFLTPMADVGAAEKAIADFFGKGVPPCVFVEWQSSLPIEIELVAAARLQAEQAESLEFITPPGMTASPVFCRVVRVNDPRTIFVSGLFAREAGDGAAQVGDVFAQLQEILKASGSDLRHLAKATYYVSDNDASAKLTELRPKFYDPARPPAASKAQVFGVGLAGRSLTLDMIAVPAK